MWCLLMISYYTCAINVRMYHHSMYPAIQAYRHIADVRALKYCSRDFRDLGLGIYSSQ